MILAKAKASLAYRNSGYTARFVHTIKEKIVKKGFYYQWINTDARAFQCNNTLSKMYTVVGIPKLPLT
jgi:hypothetical protein